MNNNSHYFCSEPTLTATVPSAATPFLFVEGDAAKEEAASFFCPPQRNASKDDNGEAEFKELARLELEDMLNGQTLDFSSAQAPCNQRKNRYCNNLPLERTRVQLAPRPHSPGSDYINASYIQPPHAAAAAAVPLSHESDDDGDDDGGDGTRGAKGDDSCDGDDDTGTSTAPYIAAQAPLASTCGDFWRMVAECGARLVVMLTRLREGDRTKASRYWPRRVGHTTRFGEVRVRLVSSHSHYGPTRDDLIVRRFLIRRVRVAHATSAASCSRFQPTTTTTTTTTTTFDSSSSIDPLQQQQQDRDDLLLLLRDGGDASMSEGGGGEEEEFTNEESEVEGEESGEGEWQEVIHLHYQAWPDFGRPEADSFQELLRMVDDFRVAAPLAPVVTHCSAGLGRTGVLIAAHIGLVQLRSGVRPNVLATVRHIRQQRPGLVQTGEQYAFLHQVIAGLLREEHRRNDTSDEACTSSCQSHRKTTTTTTPTATRTTRDNTRPVAVGKRCSSSPPSCTRTTAAAHVGPLVPRNLGLDPMDLEASFSLPLSTLPPYPSLATRGRRQHRSSSPRGGRHVLCSSTPAISSWA